MKMKNISKGTQVPAEAIVAAVAVAIGIAVAAVASIVIEVITGIPGAVAVVAFVFAVGGTAIWVVTADYR